MTANFENIHFDVTLLRDQETSPNLDYSLWSSPTLSADSPALCWSHYSVPTLARLLEHTQDPIFDDTTGDTDAHVQFIMVLNLAHCYKLDCSFITRVLSLPDARRKGSHDAWMILNGHGRNTRNSFLDRLETGLRKCEDCFCIGAHRCHRRHAADAEVDTEAICHSCWLSSSEPQTSSTTWHYLARPSSHTSLLSRSPLDMLTDMVHTNSHTQHLRHSDISKDVERCLKLNIVLN